MSAWLRARPKHLTGSARHCAYFQQESHDGSSGAFQQFASNCPGAPEGPGERLGVAEKPGHGDGPARRISRRGEINRRPIELGIVTLNTVVLLRFDVDDLGLARADAARSSHTGLTSRLLSKSFCRLWSVDHRLSLPSYQPVILASVMDRSMME
jgi:hypothetical protein